jgi:DNA-binding HxlR family transcriptional regulator
MRYRPVEVFLETIKGKYKIPILIYLKRGPRRYHEIKKKFPDASERIIIKQLKELLDAGVVDQARTGNKAPFVSTYSLSDYGRTLCSVVATMWQWGEEHMQKK